LNIRDLTPPEDLPAADAWVPGAAVRGGLACLGVTLTLVVFGTSGWLAVGIILALVAAWAPDTLTAWLLIVFLVLGQLAHHATWSAEFLVLLAGLHLVHVLATLTVELPWRSWVQPAVFLAPLRRFLAIQIPSQLLALAALLLAPTAHGHRPVTLTGAGVIGGAALAGLALVLFRVRPDEVPH
jgi:hypothetical protein